MNLLLEVPPIVETQLTGYLGALIRTNRKTEHRVEFYRYTAKEQQYCVTKYLLNAIERDVSLLPRTVSAAMHKEATVLGWL